MADTFFLTEQRQRMNTPPNPEEEARKKAEAQAQAEYESALAMARAEASKLPAGESPYNPIEEQGVTPDERMEIKMFGPNSRATLDWLAAKPGEGKPSNYSLLPGGIGNMGPLNQYEAVEYRPGGYSVRQAGVREQGKMAPWRVVDPNTGFFSKDFIGDVADLLPETAGALVPGGPVATTAGFGGLEAARQGMSEARGFKTTPGEKAQAILTSTAMGPLAHFGGKAAEAGLKAVPPPVVAGIGKAMQGPLKAEDWLRRSSRDAFNKILKRKKPENVAVDRAFEAQQAREAAEGAAREGQRAMDAADMDAQLTRILGGAKESTDKALAKQQKESDRLLKQERSATERATSAGEGNRAALAGKDVNRAKYEAKYLEEEAKQQEIVLKAQERIAQIEADIQKAEEPEAAMEAAQDQLAQLEGDIETAQHWAMEARVLRSNLTGKTAEIEEAGLPYASADEIADLRFQAKERKFYSDRMGQQANEYKGRRSEYATGLAQRNAEEAAQKAAGAKPPIEPPSMERVPPAGEAPGKMSVAAGLEESKIPFIQSTEQEIDDLLANAEGELHDAIDKINVDWFDRRMELGDLWFNKTITKAEYIAAQHQIHDEVKAAIDELKKAGSDKIRDLKIKQSIASRRIPTVEELRGGAEEVSSVARTAPDIPSRTSIYDRIMESRRSGQEASEGMADQAREAVREELAPLKSLSLAGSYTVPFAAGGALAGGLPGAGTGAVLGLTALAGVRGGALLGHLMEKLGTKDGRAVWEALMDKAGVPQAAKGALSSFGSQNRKQ